MIVSNVSMLVLLAAVLSSHFVQQAPKRQNTGLGIHSSMNVQFLVVDPLGRKTGFHALSPNDYREIPSSDYDIQSIGSLDTSDTTEIESREFSMAFGTLDTLVNGSYQVTVFCEKSGPYWLDIQFYRKPHRQFFKLRGSLSPRQTRTFLFSYESNPAVAVTIDSTQTLGKW